MKNDLAIGTNWAWEHWLDGLLINEWTDKNLFTLEGRNHVLDAAINGGTQIATWYVIPFEDNHTPASGDSYATPGFTECIVYDEATRPGWQGGTVAAGVVDNIANRASFTFNAGKDIYGAALVGGGSAGNTKGDAVGGGVLLCESKFAALEPVIAGSVLKVTIEATLNAA